MQCLKAPMVTPHPAGEIDAHAPAKTAPPVYTAALSLHSADTPTRQMDPSQPAVPISTSSPQSLHSSLSVHGRSLPSPPDAALGGLDRLSMSENGSPQSPDSRRPAGDAARSQIEHASNPTQLGTDPTTIRHEEGKVTARQWTERLVDNDGVPSREFIALIDSLFEHLDKIGESGKTGYMEASKYADYYNVCGAPVSGKPVSAEHQRQLWERACINYRVGYDRDRKPVPRLARDEFECFCAWQMQAMPSCVAIWNRTIRVFNLARSDSTPFDPISDDWIPHALPELPESFYPGLQTFSPTSASATPQNVPSSAGKAVSGSQPSHQSPYQAAPPSNSGYPYQPITAPNALPSNGYNGYPTGLPANNSNSMVNPTPAVTSQPHTLSNFFGETRNRQGYKNFGIFGAPKGKGASNGGASSNNTSYTSGQQGWQGVSYQSQQPARPADQRYAPGSPIGLPPIDGGSIPQVQQHTGQYPSYSATQYREGQSYGATQQTPQQPGYYNPSTSSSVPTTAAQGQGPTSNQRRNVVGLLRNTANVLTAVARVERSVAQVEQGLISDIGATEGLTRAM